MLWDDVGDEQLLDEEDLQGCHLYLAAVFLSCSSGERTHPLKQSWAVQAIQTLLKCLNPLLVLTAF